MRTVLLLSIFVLLGETQVAYAVPYRLAHTFRAEVPTENDYFGTAVAIEDGIVAIKSDSAYADGDGLSVTHVFEQDPAGGWTEAATFEFDSGDNQGNYFIGEELAIDGGVIAVSYGPHSDGGTSLIPIQVLTREATGWSRSFAQLTGDPPRTPPDERRFAGRGQRPAGRTVGISENVIIAEEAGVLRPDGSGFGVARVFGLQSDGSWRETANLFTSESDPHSAAAVAIDGDTAALVYRGSGRTFQPGGSLFFFERQTTGEWLATEDFRQDTTEEIGFFFRIIDIDGDVAVTRDLASGISTVFERIDGVWTETNGLPPSESYDFAHGGFALAGNLLARTVGGFPDDPPVIEIFQRNDGGAWNLLSTIDDPAPSAGLQFGSKLALDGNRLLVGASWTSPGSVDDPKPPGAAYLFVPVPEPTSLLMALAGLLTAAACRRRS